ncbi:MAG: WD40 repeat domain-containing serine/threonine protein kinase [Verrucomicrobiia bacterium]
MEASNPTVRLCSQCGAPLPADAPKGVCPQCELQGALGMLGEDSEATRTAEPSVVDTPPWPRRHFGNYELLEEIARGGMGVVYKARQRGLDRTVAVKMILVERFAGKQSVQRFRGEAAAAGVLQHPNIVAIHEIGMHEGQHFFSMDYVEGQHLAQLVGHRPLPAPQAARYVQRIAEAVHYAHEQGILHRDLKPSNVLIDAATDQPRITDFGLAKRLSSDASLVTSHSSLTLSGQVLGSPNFMPPEQASRGRGKVGRPSDVFGLGGILYFLLTARAPFQGESLEATISQVLNADPVSPRLLNPSLPRDLETICLKCLEKEPARRYATAQELADELGRFLRNEPIAARPIGLAGKALRWCRRNPVVATLAMTAGFAFLLGFAGVTWQGQRASKARDLAQGRLYESLVREARATRTARRVGYRDEVFTLLQQARALDVPQKDFTELRREAVACLGDFVGLTPVTFTDFPSNTTIGVVHMDPSWSFAAFSLSDGTLLLRQMASGTEVARLQMDYPAHRHCFNASGDQLVSVHVPTGKAPFKELIQGSVVCVWGRTADGRWRQVERTPMPGAYECFASDRQFFVGVDDPAAPAVRLIEMKSKTAVLIVPLPREMQKWAAVALSPDGKFFIVETVEPVEPGISVLDVWDLAAGRRVQRLEPRVSGVSPIIFSRDGKYFCCVSDENVVIYKMDGFQRVSEFREWSPWGARPAFAPDRDVIAVPLWQQRRVRLWDFLRNQDIAVLEEPSSVGGVRFAPDGSFLLTLGLRYARLYRLDLSAEMLRLSGHLGGVSGVCFNPDGSRVASVGKDRTLRVWEAATGHTVWQAKDLPGPGHRVAYSPDGQWFATVDAKTRLVWIWDAHTNKRLLELGTNSNGAIWSVQFSPDGRHLAIASEGDGTNASGVTVWALESRAAGENKVGLLAKLLRSLPGQFWSLAFAPDSRTLAFVNRFDGRDLLEWDMGTTSTPRRLATNLVWSLQNASFMPDGRQLLALNADWAVVTVDVATGTLTASFSTISAKQSRLPGGDVNLCLSPDGTNSPLHRPPAWEWTYGIQRVGALFTRCPTKRARCGG